MPYVWRLSLVVLVVQCTRWTDRQLPVILLVDLFLAPSYAGEAGATAPRIPVPLGERGLLPNNNRTSSRHSCTPGRGREGGRERRRSRVALWIVRSQRCTSATAKATCEASGLRPPRPPPGRFSPLPMPFPSSRTLLSSGKMYTTAQHRCTRRLRRRSGPARRTEYGEVVVTQRAGERNLSMRIRATIAQTERGTRGPIQARTHIHVYAKYTSPPHGVRGRIRVQKVTFFSLVGVFACVPVSCFTYMYCVLSSAHGGRQSREDGKGRGVGQAGAQRVAPQDTPCQHAHRGQVPRQSRWGREGGVDEREREREVATTQRPSTDEEKRQHIRNREATRKARHPPHRSSTTPAESQTRPSGRSASTGD